MRVQFISYDNHGVCHTKEVEHCDYCNRVIQVGYLPEDTTHAPVYCDDCKLLAPVQHTLDEISDFGVTV